MAMVRQIPEYNIAGVRKIPKSNMLMVRENTEPNKGMLLKCQSPIRTYVGEFQHDHRLI